MAFDYPGDPAGSAGTVPAPGPHVNPTATGIPSDGDAANAASVNPPGFETAMDWIAYFQRNRSLNDMLGGGSTAFDGAANPSAWNDMLNVDGTPISGFDILPQFASASGFNVAIGAATGHLFTAVGITPGESLYREIYWSGQNVLLATPHATLPRVDLITVTPAAFGSESTLAAVTGTAALPPLPPAVPSGSGAVFYVLVPPAAADSTTFRACRGMGRRIGYPWSGMTGIIEGCELSWDYTADPNSAGAMMLVGAGDKTGTNMGPNRILIDGEALEWVGFGGAPISGGGGIVQDSTADPFGSPASGGADRPYYVYACGGRHNPLPSPGYGNAFLNPVTFVESTVAPNPKTGKPTANLTVNGVTVVPNGAVYLGLGFVVQGTQFRRACVMDGEMTYSLDRLQIITHTFTSLVMEDVGTFTGGCQPAISTKMAINIRFTAPSADDGSVEIRLADFTPLTGSAALVSGIWSGWVAAGKSVTVSGQKVLFTPRQGAELWAAIASATTSGNALTIGAMGFDHRVRRLLAGY